VDLVDFIFSALELQAAFLWFIERSKIIN